MENIFAWKQNWKLKTNTFILWNVKKKWGLTEIWIPLSYI